MVVLAALGQPARVCEIALILRPTWDRVVNNLQVQDAGDCRAPARALTPVEEARLESLRRVCCLRSGRPVDRPGDVVAPAAPAVAPAPFPPAGRARLAWVHHRRRPESSSSAPCSTQRSTPRFSPSQTLKSKACMSDTAIASVTSPAPTRRWAMWQPHRGAHATPPRSRTRNSGTRSSPHQRPSSWREPKDR